MASVYPRPQPVLHESIFSTGATFGGTCVIKSLTSFTKEIVTASSRNCHACERKGNAVSTVEADASRMAKLVAKHLESFMVDQKWISNSPGNTSAGQHEKP